MKMFAATFAPMSFEDPESDSPSFTKWVSSDRQKLIDAAVSELKTTWGETRVDVQPADEFGGEVIEVLAGDDGDFDTYYRIEEVEVL
jgi:hypothetical protein